VVLNRWRRPVLGVLCHPVGPDRARGEDLEYDDRIRNYVALWRHRRTGNECVRVTHIARENDLEVGVKSSARPTAEAVLQGTHDIEADRTMRDAPAGHRERLKAVELVTQLLPPFPCQELVQGHRPAQRLVHG